MAKNEIPNAKTIAAMEETNLESFDSLEELMEDLKAPESSPEVEAVVTSEETKVYKFNADVFIFDDQQQATRRINYDDATVEFSNPVPVYNDAYKLIGSATLDLQGKTLTGSFFIDYATPERLNLETKEIPLFPHLDSHSEVVAVHGGVFRATRVVVNSIQLTMTPTLDSRIGSL